MTPARGGNQSEAPVPAWLKAVEYRISAHLPAQWPPDEGREVAFAGRSNVGKSSALNAIAGRRGLARASKTPGRTRQIVFFTVDDRRRLVDLPGYGFAKVPEAMRRHWEQLIADYFHQRCSLTGLFLVMDIRHPLKPLDRQMLDWAGELPVHILLTKADKLSRGAAARTLQQVRAGLEGRPATTVQLFSSLRRNGLEAAREQLARWLDCPSHHGVSTAGPNQKKAPDLGG